MKIFNLVSYFVSEDASLTKYSPFKSTAHLCFTRDTNSLKNKVCGWFYKKNSLKLSVYSEFFLGQYNIIIVL